MNKCLKITFTANFSDDFLQSFIQKQAKELDLEGIVQIIGPGRKVRIIACGVKEAVDQFVDTLQGSDVCHLEDIEIEPFLKDKDYRGVFRVIE
jgi:acylphosphatase